MSWAQPVAAPAWLIPLAVVVGAGVGWLLGVRLRTLGYRLDEEKGPGPRLPVPGVAVLTAALWGLLTWRFGAAAHYTLAPAYLTLATGAVALAWVDADVHRLPRGLTAPLLPLLVGQLALASTASGDWAALRRALLGGAAMWLALAVLALVAALLGSAFGWGDVRVAGLVGIATAHVSWWGPVIATYAAFLLAGAYAASRLVLRRGGLRDAIAFGPWLLAGGLVALLVEVNLMP